MRTISYIMLIAIVAGCGSEQPVTQPRVPPLLGDRTSRPVYDITELDTLGPTNQGSTIDNQGLVAGFSVSAAGIMHATVWQDGSPTSLGAVGGPDLNSGVLWPGLNHHGMVAGVTEIADVQPNGEDWSCAAFFYTETGHICRGFIFADGTMHVLPTLGGDNGFAAEVNDSGQVVGWAETTVHDPTCRGNQVLQFRAALWDTRTGTTTELPPVAGDSASAATAINDSGEVVGISGDCDVAVGRFSARHAVRWDHGTVTQLADLGGVAWNTPMDINAEGDAVGFVNLSAGAGSHFVPRAVLWPRGGTIEDLGRLQGDSTSQALGINARGQIVGTSCGGGACHAFVYEDGRLMALDSLAAPGFADHLDFAQDIDDAGRITGLASRADGTSVAFVAVPRVR